MDNGIIIWDNCSKEESDLIESLQLQMQIVDAARIITGLRKGTSRLRIYNELDGFLSRMDYMY